MGVVYEALNEVTDRHVALKLMLPHLARDPRERQRFLREAKTAARFKHQNVVYVQDAGTFEGQPYIVMDLIEGSDLRALLKEKGALPAELAADIIGQAADGLDHVHRQRSVHRDIKPANLMVTHDWRVVVTDFGLGLLEGATRQTSTGKVAASFAYAAPEQFTSDKIDPRTDVYALGGTLYSALTGGRPPFEFDDVRALMHAHLKAHPPAPSAHAPELLPFDAVVSKAMAKEPADRYASAADLGNAARAAAREAAATAEHVLAPAPTIRKWRRVSIATACVFAVAVAVGAAAVFEVGAVDNATPTPPTPSPLKPGVLAVEAPCEKAPFGRQAPPASIGQNVTHDEVLELWGAYEKAYRQRSIQRMQQLLAADVRRRTTDGCLERGRSRVIQSYPNAFKRDFRRFELGEPAVIPSSPPEATGDFLFDPGTSKERHGVLRMVFVREPDGRSRIGVVEAAPGS